MKKLIISGLAGFALIFFPGNSNAQRIITSMNIAASNPEENKMKDPPAKKAGEYEIGKTTDKNARTELDKFWLDELDSLGNIHNSALDYAVQRIRSMGITGLTAEAVPELVATVSADFFAERYGSAYNFSPAQLKKEILKTGLVPDPPVVHDMSDGLRAALTSMSNILEGMRETETSADFRTRVGTITESTLGSLNEKEKVYLRGYADVLVKSFDYWDRNAYNWVYLFGTSIPLAGNCIVDKNDEGIDELGGMYLVGEENRSRMQSYANPGIDPRQSSKERHPCAKAIISADGSGLFSGLVRGCVAGALFGAGVGCIPAAIFWGGVQAVTSSLGAGIVCIALDL